MGEIPKASRRLAKEGFAFMVMDNNCQITLMKGNEIIDFWANTGLWWIRGTRNKRRGIERLVRYMKQQDKT